MFTFSDSNTFSSRSCVWVNGPVIVGAGPSGLPVASGLREQGVAYVILEKADCIASLWQKRTHDLKLHRKQFCQLPNFPFPRSYPDHPSRRQFVEYLESYARKFDIKPRFNERVQSTKYDETCGLWRVKSVCGDGSEFEYICRGLVVATVENAERVVPEIDGLSNFGGEVIHACDYKSGENYRGKKVLVVGCGNSGLEVFLDLCNHDAKPAMVVRSSVQVLPREIFGKSTFGLKRPSLGPLELKNNHGKTPVLDIGARKEFKSREIEVVPGIKRFPCGMVELVNGEKLDIDAVLLATGYFSNVPNWLQNGFPKTPFPNGRKGKTGSYAEKVVPDFWLNAMKNNEVLAEEISERDERALKFLKDVKWSGVDNPKGFTLEFYFDTNPFFKNSVLTKTYHMIDEDEPILEKAIGVEIEWHPGKCLTQKILKKNPKKGSKNAKRITKTEQCVSFFNFFSPPQVPDEEDDIDEDAAEELQNLMEQDYDIGSTIRNKIIPHAVWRY